MVSEKYQDLNVQNSINAKAIGADLLAAIKQAVFDMEHPIGDVEEQRLGEQTPAQKYGMGTWTLDTTHEGRTEIGASDTYPLGSTGGEATHALTVAEMARHNHGNLNSPLGQTLCSAYGQQYGPVGGVAPTTGNQSYPYETGYRGDSQPFNLMQPYLAVNYWKRVS